MSGSWMVGRLMSADAKSSDELAKINSQIAELSLKLAETELQVLVDANEKLANTFPRSAVDRLQQVVNAAKQRAAQTSKENGANVYSSYVTLTGGEMNAAALDYRTAMAANSQIKDAVPPLELERLRIAAELAKLRNERAQKAADVPDIVLVNWQLEDLRDQVRRLAQQVQLYRGNE